MVESNDWTKPLAETPAAQPEQRAADYDDLARRLDEELARLWG